MNVSKALGYAKQAIYFVKILLFKKSSYGPKVFCVGYNKTGTTTLGKSLEMLGYENMSFYRFLYRNVYMKGHRRIIVTFAARFDSFDDLPWLCEDMIPTLDKAFPQSKFIYLERDEDSWFSSMYKHKTMKKGIEPNMEKELNKFREHRKFVYTYFKDAAADRFLSISISDPTGFQKLADFLGKSAPQKEFPIYNKS